MESGATLLTNGERRREEHVGERHERRDDEDVRRDPDFVRDVLPEERDEQPGPDEHERRRGTYRRSQCGCERSSAPSRQHIPRN